MEQPFRQLLLAILYDGEAFAVIERNVRAFAAFLVNTHRDIAAAPDLRDRADEICASNREKLGAFCPRCKSGDALSCELAGATGLEPATSGVTGRRSNQLSYTPAGPRKGAGI